MSAQSLIDRVFTKAKRWSTRRRVFIALRLGQSNQVGHGPATIDNDRLDVPNPRILQWGPLPSDGATGTVHYSGEWSVAIDPIDQHGNSGGGIGPSGEWARRVLPTLGPSDVIGLVGGGHGGTGMLPVITPDNPSWLPEGTEGSPNLYENAIAQCLAAKAAAEELFPDSEVVIQWIDWIQGESDGANTANYEDQLVDLFTGLRTRLDAPNALINVGQMTPEYITGNRVIIDSIHQRIPTLLERASFAPGPSGHIYGDGSSHYDSVGYRLLGRSEAAALPRATTNVTGRAPVAPTVTVVQQPGNELFVTIGLPTGRYTEFAIEYREGTSGAWTTVTRTYPANYQETITGINLDSHYQVRAATVNEEATSTYTLAELDTVDVPGQATGLVAADAEGTRMGLTWDPTTGATEYLVEYKKTSDSEWTAFGEVETESATVTGLTPSTSYDFRVTPENVAGAGTASSTDTESTTAINYLITDVGVSAARAYSVARKLVSGYAGSAIRVRRSSDNTEQDIGFSSDVLDTAGLLTFVGAGNGFLTKIYDQSGNGRDLAQATTAAQPRIVNSGVIDMRSSFPAGIWDGVDDYMVHAGAGAYAAGAASALMVAAAVARSGAVLWREANSTSSSVAYGEGTDSAGRFNTLIRNDAGTSLLAQQHGLSPFTGDTGQWSWVDTGTAVNAWLNGAQGTNRPYSRSGTLTLVQFGVGAYVRSTVTGVEDMALNELVVWHSALSDGNRQAGEINQKTFYGTP